MVENKEVRMKGNAIDEGSTPAANPFPCRRVSWIALVLVLQLPSGTISAATPALTRFPTLHGDAIVFEAGGNLWRVSRSGGEALRLTTDLGDTGIVLQCGGSLYVIDLPSERIHKVEVIVGSDDVRMRPRWVDAFETVQDFGLAPNGKRALFEARGEIFTVPIEHGNTRDLTRTSGAREERPSWSPDGKWVAYATDRSGEAQIAIRPSDGTGEETQLTKREKGYLYGPEWAPDSERLAYSDSDHVLWYVEITSRKVMRVDQDELL
jgi:tricorn protease